MRNLPAALLPGPARRHGAAVLTALLAVVALALGVVSAPSAQAAAPNPIGSFDVAQGVFATDSVYVGGWALDPSTASSIYVDVYADGVGLAHLLASGTRSDVAAAYPGYGPAHGFGATVGDLSPGSHSICAYAIAVGGGSNVQLGCITAVVDDSPIGSLDAVRATGSQVFVGGWTLDPDAPSPGQVTVTADGASIGTLTADGDRPDVAAAYPGFSSRRGFSGTLGNLAQGSHTVCVTAVNRGAGSDRSLGCRQITTAINPFGSLDVASAVHDQVRVAGWAADFNGPVPTVKVTADGVAIGSVTVAGSRPDVAAAFPGVATVSGFDAVLGHLTQGPHTICVTAVNSGPGVDTQIGCTQVTISILPFGSFDFATPVTTSDQVSVVGWAVDPDTLTTPIYVDFYEGSTGLAHVLANAPRPDVPGAVPGAGGNLGFNAVIGHLSQGSHTICAYAINVGPGNSNPVLGCKTVQIALNPFGSIDRVTRTGPTTAIVSGWAMDPNSTGATTVTASLNGTSVATAVAGGARPDLVPVFNNGANHGYTLTVPVGADETTVCVTSSNLGPGAATSIGCEDVPRQGATAPAQPGRVTSVGGYGQVTVTWQPPTDTGGAIIRSYTVVADPGGIRLSVPAGTLTATLSGLPPATTYSVGVAAVNVIGSSLVSYAAPVSTSSSPAPQTTTPPVSTSRYIRNLDGSSNDVSYYRNAGAADAAANPSGHRYLSLLDIGGQNSTGVLLSATSRYASYATLVRAVQAYVDGYASAQQSVAPVTIAIGTNNDVLVNAQTGAAWAQQVINPVAAYAARYSGVTIAGANDIEPGFSAGPSATRAWLSGYLGATSAPFINNGSADGCSQNSPNSGCNNGWTMADLYWLSMGAAPGRMAALPQIYYTSQSRQWKQISLTGVLSGGSRISFGGVLTEVAACAQAGGTCYSMSGATAWNTLWSDLQSDSRVAVGQMAWATDLRIN